MDATAHELTFMHIPKMRDTKISVELISDDITEKGITLLTPKLK